MPANYDLVGPFRGPCGICGGPDARHRIYDAVRDYFRAGESILAIAGDYDETPEWVQAIVDDPESEWTVRIPAVLAPNGHVQWLNENDRIHWAKRRDLVAQYREKTGWLTKQAKVPTLKRAKIHALLHFTDARRRDPGNWMPTVKACVDGIVDAGVLKDDSAAYLDGPHIHLGDVWDAPTVELVIEEV